MASSTAKMGSSLVRLQRAITEGRCEEAAALAFELALDKTPCVISDGLGHDNVESIQLTIVVEKDAKHIQTVNLDVLPNNTLLDLKTKIYNEYQYAPNCQQWIINNKLVKTETSTLAVLGITSDKRSDVFLNLIESRKRPVHDAPPVRSTNKTFGDESNAKEWQGAIGKMTQRPKKVETKAPLGWVCTMCTFVNEPTRPGCQMCSSPPPENYKVPKNYVRTKPELERLKKEQDSERAMEEAARRKQQRARDKYNDYLAMDHVNLVRNEEPFECPICLENVERHQGINLRDCLHSFCDNCLQGHINNCDDPAIRCPSDGCASFMLDREIIELVPAEVYQQYLQRGMNIAEVQIKNSYHCKTPDCRGWCIFEEGVNRFDCPICNAQNCLTCRIIHQNLTCKEYQDDLVLRAKTDEDAKKTVLQIQEMLRNNDAVNCRGCGVIIMKTSGCPHIVCTYCKHDTRYEKLKATG